MMKSTPVVLVVLIPFAMGTVSLHAETSQRCTTTSPPNSKEVSQPAFDGPKLVQPATKEMINVGAHEVQILRGGSGSPTVVLEAGLGGTLDTWKDVLPALNGFTGTVSYSRAGYGASEMASGPRTPEAIADELHTMLMNSGVVFPVVLVGHSLGAIYVRAFAMKYPNEVAGLVLVDGSHERQFQEAFGGDPAEVSRQIRESVPDAAPPQIRAEWAAMIPIYLSGKLDIEGKLPDIPFASVTSLRIPAPTGMSSNLSEAVRVQVPNIKRRLNAEVFKTSRNGIEIVTTHSGHFIQNDEPALVVDAIRWVVEASRRSNQP